ncbi:MAG: hypothetical protein ACM3ML_00210 [Micromonosporaceae bacterium]
MGKVAPTAANAVVGIRDGVSIADALQGKGLGKALIHTARPVALDAGGPDTR